MSSLFLPIAKRFIAGERAEEALQQCKSLNAKGFKVLVNYLGEDTSSGAEVDANVQEYLHLYDLLEQDRVAGSASVKLTQLGLGISFSEALNNLERLAAKAESLNRYLWLDMEGTRFTEDTIGAYLAVLERHKGVGVALQAYLKRTAADLGVVLGKGGQVRVCKGAYDEPASVAFKGRKTTVESYKALLKRLFEQESHFAVATHDAELIEFAAEMASDTKKQNFEFQMLKGVGEDMARDLVANGYAVSIYVPYGTRWAGYAMRRIRERRRNVLLLLRALVGA